MSDKEKISKALRQLVWNTHIGIEYGIGKCFCCGFVQISQSNFHCGHIKSEKQGGELTLDNLVPVCGGCNSSMSDIDMIKFMDGQHIPRAPLDTMFINSLNTFANDMFTDFRVHYQNQLDGHDASGIVAFDQSDDNGHTSHDAVHSHSKDGQHANCKSAHQHEESVTKGPPYNCSRCGKEFSMKNDYRRHVNRKFPCQISPAIKQKGPPYNCDRCGKVFSMKNDYRRHINRKFPCKVQPDIAVDLDHPKIQMSTTTKKPEPIKPQAPVQPSAPVKPPDILKCDNCQKTFTRRDNLQKHIREHCKSLKSSKKNASEKPKESTHTKVTAFGNEDLNSLISEKEVINYLNHGSESVIMLCLEVYFNPKRPKFHSVFISDKNRSLANVYDGEHWESLDKNKIVDRIFNKLLDYLNDMFKKLGKKLLSETIYKYGKFMNNTDANMIIDIKKDILQALYNKRHIPMITKKASGK